MAAAIAAASLFVGLGTPSGAAVRSARSAEAAAAAPRATSAAGGEVEREREREGGGGDEGRHGGCPACGNAEIVGGCNGEGRIQGGIGALPGFGWLPIKAYRPCPAFVEKGGRYRRTGQSLEEVAFGRKGASDDLDVSERLKR